MALAAQPSDEATPSRTARAARRRALALALASALLAAACWGAAEERALVGHAGEGLVFARAHGAQSDLYRARLADGDVRPFFATSDRAESWPFWAEAAQRLVFQVEPVPGDSADLWAWQAGEAAPGPLAARADRDERWPEWSPDGARLVFAFRERGGARGSGLAWLEVEGGREVTVVTSGPRDLFFRPSFDPSGRRLVAQRRGADGRGSRIWIADERGARPLVGEPDWFEQKPFFTRTGDTVLFARQRGGGPRQLARAGLSGAVAPLAAGRASADEHSARPSPTRDEFAFVSDRGGSRDVWLAPLAGGEARNLTATRDRDEFAPRWSPDGERLVLTAAPPGPPGRTGDRLARGATTLVVIDREGLVLLETAGMMADWMPPF